jgi:hypothetical protein
MGAAAAQDSERTRARIFSLAPLVLRPPRARLDQARAVVAERERASEAWFGLATSGLIPGRWVDDPRRRFGPRSLCGSDDCEHGITTIYGSIETLCEECLARPVADRLRAHPPSRQMCARMASHAASAERAEELARETARRFARPGERAADVVLWRTIEAETWQQELINEGLWKHTSPVPIEGRDFHGSSLYSTRISEAERVARHSLLAALRLDALTSLSVLPDQRRGWRRGQHPSRRSGALCKMVLTAVAALDWLPDPDPSSGQIPPNPFEPMLDLFATGHVLESITPDYLVLGSPRRRFLPKRRTGGDRPVAYDYRQ